jgi:hypothetical protein
MSKEHQAVSRNTDQLLLTLLQLRENIAQQQALLRNLEGGQPAVRASLEKLADQYRHLYGRWKEEMETLLTAG